MIPLLQLADNAWRCIKRFALCALIVMAAYSTATSVALADDPYLSPPPAFMMIDVNGMNLNTQGKRFYGPSVSVGQSGKGGLSWSTYAETDQWSTDLGGNIKALASGPIVVTLMGNSEEFYYTGTVYGPYFHTGGSLTFDGTNYTYTKADGTVAIFAPSSFTCYVGVNCTTALLTTFTYPDGEALSFNYRTLANWYGLVSATNNLGYQIKVNYQCSSPTTSACYYTVDNVIAINNAVDYCDPTANSCTSLSQSWPTMAYTYSMSGYYTTAGVSDARGNVTNATFGSPITGILGLRFTRPSGSYIYNQNYYICDGCPPYIQDMSDGSDPSHPWDYAFTPNDDGIEMTTDVTDPRGVVRELLSDDQTGFPEIDIVDLYGLGLTTQYDNDGAHITGIFYPEGNHTNYTYDTRGNLTEVRKVAKAGSGFSDIVTSAVFPSSCTTSNYRICNKPTAIIDANGNETDYTYDAAHGGILTETGPPVNGGRPQTRYTYTAMYAWYKTSPTTIAAAATPVYRLTSTSKCMVYTGSPVWGTPNWGSFNWTAATSCSGSSKEIVTSYAYPTGSSSAATNLLPSSTSSGAGDSSITATVATTFDFYSNVATTTGPISGDTKAFFYDLDHHQIGAIQPDPVGSGTYPATQTTIDGDNRVSEVEQGTTTSQSSMSTFASLTEETFAFDGYTGLKISDTKALGGTTQSITQYNYDGVRNLSCTAIRENPSVFGSLPGACSLSTSGSFGTDQIDKNNYDAANRVTSIQHGYGTGSPITYVTNAYTANSRVDYVEDANGNRSDYTYDGQDRLVKLNFPSPTTSHTPSTTDYETYSYDPNGNLLTKRLRSGDADTIVYTYDALNRQILKDIPGGSSTDVYSAYNLVGNLLYSHFGSSGGSGIDYSYDALGRKLSETSYGLTVNSQYDLAGSRTCLEYPDGQYIQYTYDILNRMKQVQQRGTSACGTGSPTVLAEYSYDYLSRETGITRNANPATTSYSYSSTSQSYSLTQDMYGTGQDVTLSLSFTPATQLYQRGLSNTAYAYSAPALSRSYTPNGLNQYASVGGTSYTYDARGNLTSDGSRGFSYDVENRLTSETGSTSMTLTYDPKGRLRQTASSSTEQYLYDGDDLIAEYNGSTVLRRYVPGRDTDETLVWYEGAGLSTPAWLHTDEQGSTIATTDPSGSATVYVYSASGEPTSWSGPRFRYTGQAALPEISLYYYKARMYDPTLGRFLQTDPVGYTTDYNLYAYVGNDYPNKTDSTGMAFGLDDLAGIVIGGVVGVGVQLIENVATGQKTTLGSLAGSFVAGAIVGEGTVNAPETGGVSFAAAVGGLAGAAGNATEQGVDIATGEQQTAFSTKGVVVSGAVGVVLGGATEGVLPRANIPGLSSGRGNMDAVGRGVQTKIANGTVQRMAPQTAIKAAVGSQAANSYKTLGTGLTDAMKIKVCSSAARYSYCQ